MSAHLVQLTRLLQLQQRVVQLLSCLWAPGLHPTLPAARNSNCPRSRPTDLRLRRRAPAFVHGFEPAGAAAGAQRHVRACAG